MTPHRPPGKRPAAHTVRQFPHAHSHREARKPAQFHPRPAVKSAARRGDPLWSPIPGEPRLIEAESIVVEAIDRMARPVTARELAIHSWDVAGLTGTERADALLGLARRGVLRRVCRRAGDRITVLFGFPEQFDEEAESGES